MDINRFKEANEINNRINANKVLIQNYEELVNILDDVKLCDVVAKDYNKYSKQLYLGNMISDCMLIIRSNRYCKNRLDLTPLVEDMKTRILFLKEKIKDDEYKFNNL